MNVIGKVVSALVALHVIRLERTRPRQLDIERMGVGKFRVSGGLDSYQSVFECQRARRVDPVGTALAPQHLIDPYNVKQAGINKALAGLPIGTKITVVDPDQIPVVGRFKIPEKLLGNRPPKNEWINVGSYYTHDLRKGLKAFAATGAVGATLVFAPLIENAVGLSYGTFSWGVFGLFSAAVVANAIRSSARDILSWIEYKAQGIQRNLVKPNLAAQLATDFLSNGEWWASMTLMSYLAKIGVQSLMMGNIAAGLLVLAINAAFAHGYPAWSQGVKHNIKI